ncbi:MAG TPA: glycosyltransferase family 2 protein [Rhodothermales bacterium]|nr:glycosyltransferase family 2 protein [Rhodothermales bacterium]
MRSNGRATASSKHQKDLSVIALIIPAQNEEASIGMVVSELPSGLLRDVIVVDNGSTDSTADAARAAGATVLSEPRAGYGWACLRGIDYLAQNPPDVVVFMDGDRSDYPSDLPAVVRPIVDNEADLVIGSRTIGRRERGALLPQAVVGNRFACAVIRSVSGVRFTDLGPFRAIRYSDLVALDLKEMRYGWTVEMQIKAVKKGLRCVEVPVSYRKRIGRSKVTGTVSGTIKASARILWVLARYAFGSG